MSKITTTELQKILENIENINSIVIDVRTESEYRNEKISHKVKNIPDSQILNHSEELGKFDKIYIHCQSGNRSQKVVDLLYKKGFTNVYDVEGGITNWKNQKFGTISNGKLPIIRQVFIAASSLILLGSMGSFAIPNLIIIPIGVGCGLMFSGLTGNCMMANLLSKMPWNK